MNQLIAFVVCALAGCTHFIILHNYLTKDILSAIYGVQIQI